MISIHNNQLLLVKLEDIVLELEKAGRELVPESIHSPEQVGNIQLMINHLRRC